MSTRDHWGDLCKVEIHVCPKKLSPDILPMTIYKKKKKFFHLNNYGFYFSTYIMYYALYNILYIVLYIMHCSLYYTLYNSLYYLASAPVNEG